VGTKIAKGAISDYVIGDDNATGTHMLMGKLEFPHDMLIAVVAVMKKQVNRA
jgi:hypothetical protein